MQVHVAVGLKVWDPVVTHIMDAIAGVLTRIGAPVSDQRLLKRMLPHAVYSHGQGTGREVVGVQGGTLVAARGGVCRLHACLTAPAVGQMMATCLRSDHDVRLLSDQPCLDVALSTSVWFQACLGGTNGRDVGDPGVNTLSCQL